VSRRREQRISHNSDVSQVGASRIGAGAGPPDHATGERALTLCLARDNPLVFSTQDSMAFLSVASASAPGQRRTDLDDGKICPK